MCLIKVPCAARDLQDVFCSPEDHKLNGSRGSLPCGVDVCPLLKSFGQPIDVCNVHVLDDCLIENKTPLSFPLYPSQLSVFSCMFVNDDIVIRNEPLFSNIKIFTIYYLNTTKAMCS